MKLFLLSIILLSSCSLKVARQSFSTSELSVKGGIFERDQWEDTMMFRRFSWFQEANLSYDVLLHKFDKQSPFKKWFTLDKIERFNCKDVFVALIYTSREAQLNQAYVVNKFEKKGFKQIGIANFRNNITAHYAIGDSRLTLHKVYGFCQQTDLTPTIKLSFPGFYRRTIDPYQKL